MRGYLQRLVEDRAPMPKADMRAVRPVAPSESPVVESDQLLQFEGYDGFADAAAADVTADVPPARQTRAGPPEQRAHAPAASAEAPVAKTTKPPTVTRFARPSPALPQAQTTPAPPPALPATSAAAPPPVAPPRPAPVDAAEAAPRKSGDRLDATPPPPSRVMSLPEAMVVSERRARAVEGDVVSPISAERPEPAARPAPMPRPALVAEARPVPASVVTEQPAMPSELPLPPPLAPREIPLRDAEPARTPQPVRDSVIVRETIRTVETPPPKPAAPPQRTPRTAEEASVIGPLPRPEKTRALLELWLR
jgi:hypothetical protein